MARVAPALKRPHAGKAPEGKVRRDFRVARDERPVPRRLGDELEPKAFRVVEAKPILFADRVDAGGGKAPRPELERLVTGHPERDTVDHPRAGAASGQARVLEEREVCAGASVLVGVEEVVDGGVVLVDGLLDQPEPHHAGVEEDVFGGVGRDRADVVDSVEGLHSLSSTHSHGAFVPADIIGLWLCGWWGLTAMTRSGTAKPDFT